MSIRTMVAHLSAERRLIEKSIAGMAHPVESVRLALAAHSEGHLPRRTKQPSHKRVESSTNGSE